MEPLFGPLSIMERGPRRAHRHRPGRHLPMRSLPAERLPHLEPDDLPVPRWLGPPAAGQPVDDAQPVAAALRPHLRPPRAGVADLDANAGRGTAIQPGQDRAVAVRVQQAVGQELISGEDGAEREVFISARGDHGRELPSDVGQLLDRLEVTLEMRSRRYRRDLPRQAHPYSAAGDDSAWTARRPPRAAPGRSTLGGGPAAGPCPLDIADRPAQHSRRLDVTDAGDCCDFGSPAVDQHEGEIRPWTRAP
jgi:hypothetical protein